MAYDWLTQNRKGLAIVRVSSRQQEGNISHETQEEEIRAYCEANEIEIAEVRRIVESAKESEGRKEYRAAVEFALASGIRHLLYYMTDREVRNFTDLEAMEKLILRDRVVVHYVRDRRMLHAQSPVSDFSNREIEAWRDKQYSRTLSAKIRDAVKRKVASGWYPGSQPPLGYICRRDESGRSYVVPDESVVKWVQREFELRALGLTFEEIRTRVVAEGLVPKDQIPKYRFKMIAHRTQNPFYWGRFRWEGKEHPGKHELIIPDWILERVARVERGYSPKRIDPTQEHGLLAFGGFLKCVCGCAVVYEPKKKTYRTTKRTQVFHYYRCTNGKKVHAKRAYIREDVLWAMLDQAVDAISLTPEVAQRIADALNGTHREAVVIAARTIAEAKAKLKEIREREDKAAKHLIDDVLDRQAYGRIREELRAEAAEWQARLEGAQFQATGRYHETAQSVVELCKRAKALYLSRSMGERRKFLERLVSNLRLDGLSLRYDYKKPFQSIVDLQKNGDWWRRWESFLTDCAHLQGGNHLGEPTFIELLEDRRESARA